MKPLATVGFGWGSPLVEILDANGNIISFGSDGNLYDGAGNFRFYSAPGTANSVNEYSTLSYNGRGDLTDDTQGFHYGYDALDRLISITPDYAWITATSQKRRNGTAPIK